MNNLPPQVRTQRWRRRRAGSATFERSCKSVSKKQPRFPNISISYVGFYQDGGESERGRHEHGPYRPDRSSAVGGQVAEAVDGGVGEVVLKHFNGVAPLRKDSQL